MAGTWEERQRAFVERLGDRGISDLEEGTVVVLPSATFPVAELRKITAIQYYEERMLFTVLQLRRPRLQMVYLTSVPVDPVIVDYYLSFLPDPVHARRRLELVAVGDPAPRPLTAKLLDRPDVVARVRALADDPAGAYVLPFNVTPLEGRLSDELELPVYGAAPDLAVLGSKSGSRRVARRAGVAVLPGREDLRSVEQVAAAIDDLARRDPRPDAAVVKLNNGFSGQGNAIIELDHVGSPLEESNTTFCAAEESWPTFAAKIEDEGAIVEELVRREGTVSPSVQVRIAPSGVFEVVSTHDQILGGPDNQVYLGCRFPAAAEYRLSIQDAAVRVAEVLAGEGVIGSFGIDFVVVPGDGGHDVYLSEINLRMGGTTHPFWMARLALGGTYDPATGELRADGRAKSYVASDNLKSHHLEGRTPAQVIDAVDAAGLGFDPDRGIGSTLHLLGAVREFGKMGLTCVADSPAEADELYHRTVAAATGIALPHDGDRGAEAE